MAPLKLNPEAPEFIPSQSLSISIYNSQPYFLLFPSFYSHQPTATLAPPPPSVPIHQPPQHHKVRNNSIKNQLFKGFITSSRPSHPFTLKPFTSTTKSKLQQQQQRSDVPQRDDKKSTSSFPYRRKIRHQHCFRKRYGPLLPVRECGDETTVMIRNVPSKYTRDMVVDFLDDHCLAVNRRDKETGKDEGEDNNVLAFDFVYLPIDFKSGLNKGYAFVNFTQPKAAWKFLLTASNMKWSLFQSHKIREVVAARLQGKEKLERHFETMNFPCESEDVLPVCFSPPRDGVTKGKQRTVGRLMFKSSTVSH